jgi:UTP-glucose-1-phosphate uridylyltransferase
MSRTLVVLAAGIGSRYGGLKQMDPVGPSGEFILDYSVYDALRAGFDRTVFVIRRDLEEAFRETLGRRLARHARVAYAYQALDDLPAGRRVPEGRTKPWGTGHAVLAAREAVDGPFAVINADDYYGRESYAALGDFLGRTAADARAYAMVGFVLRNTVSAHGSVARGICTVGAAGRLEAVVERTHIERQGDRMVCPEQPLSGDELVSMNMWGFKPSIFDALERDFRDFLEAHGGDPRAEFFMPTVVNDMIAKGAAAVTVLETPCRWVGVTNREDKPAVVAAIRALVDAGVYPASLW